MNTISSNGQMMARDGQAFFTAATQRTSKVPVQAANTLPDSAAEVSQTLAKNLSEAEEIVKELQKLSDMVLGHKIQFNVNDELGRVVVKVVDPSTNRVIREIPSEDLQKIQIQMKHAIGLLFDEMI